MIRFVPFAALAFTLFVAGPALAQSVTVPSSVPYAADSRIPQNIKQECTDLGDKLARFLAEYAEKNDVQTSPTASPDPNAGGRVFVVEITDAVSAGNAFIGHRKSMSARGVLYQGGKQVGSVDFTRNSGGGFAGGYKGSCAVLGRCTKALGKDLAEWLAKQ